MIGPVQYRNVTEYPGTTYPGLTSRARRATLAESAHSGWGGGSSSQRGSQYPSKEQLSVASQLRKEIEELEEPERWDGLA